MVFDSSVVAESHSCITKLIPPVPNIKPFWRNGGRQVGLCTESCVPGAQLASQQPTVIKGGWILNWNVIIVTDSYRVAFTQYFTTMLALVTFGYFGFIFETISIKNRSLIIWPKRVALASSSSGCFALICGIAICKEWRLVCWKMLMSSQSQLFSTLTLVSYRTDNGKCSWLDLHQRNHWLVTIEGTLTLYPNHQYMF